MIRSALLIAFLALVLTACSKHEDGAVEPAPTATEATPAPAEAAPAATPAPAEAAPAATPAPAEAAPAEKK